jgi:hypothetical protein
MFGFDMALALTHLDNVAFFLVSVGLNEDFDGAIGLDPAAEA